MDESNQKYDISGAQTRVSRLRSLVGNLQNSVEAVDPSVTARSQGGLTTEAQRSALVNRERQPILDDLAKQQDAYGQAQGDWTMANQLAGDYARTLISDENTQYSRLKDNYATALAAEQAAEERRRWEAQQAMAREQAAAEERRFQQQLKAAGGGGYNLGGSNAVDQLIKQWQQAGAGGNSAAKVAAAQTNAAKAAADQGRFSPSMIAAANKLTGNRSNLLYYNPLTVLPKTIYDLSKSRVGKAIKGWF